MLRNQHAAHSTKKVARKSLHCWAATLTTVPEIGLAVKPCAAQVCHIAARLTHHQLCASMAAVAPIAAVHARIMPADLGVPARLVLVDLCLPVDAPIVVVLRCLALDGRPTVPAVLLKLLAAGSIFLSLIHI